ncbi:MAG: pyridoxal phosphate-dependent aminotransferase [Duodenibacillus sp.]|nr:pyridoxal phosphate-dependent aminotransferase [Duodenibacillus sp.]
MDAPWDFDELVERRGTHCCKWDGQDPDVIPLWIADMDFRTAPAVIRAVRERAEHGVFGYTEVPRAWYEAVQGWFARRHGWAFEPGWLQYTSGVVPALSCAIKAMTSPGDEALVLTPVYNCFFSSIRNNGCRAVECPLVVDGGGRWGADWEAVERHLARGVRLMVLCNPHNPAGTVWTAAELRRLGGLAERYGARVISDEIHGEFVWRPEAYVPMGLACGDPDWLVTLTAPSKAFNIAGLQIAAVIAADAGLRARIDRAINDNEVCDVNPFGVAATIAAYTEGEPWLEAMLAYVGENRRFAARLLAERAPAFPATPRQGTYLEWVDCSALGIGGEAVAESLMARERVRVAPGGHYGEAGRHFIRINAACPRATLAEGLGRVAGGLARLLRERG